MNEKDRDRSGDGAGPVAHIDSNKSLKALCGIIMLLFFCVPLRGEPMPLDVDGNRLRGLSLIVDVGVLNASDIHANFYNGNPNNVNTLNRILHSETYGHAIWNRLTELDLINSTVSDYNHLKVDEYGDMYYQLAMQLGLGFRYDLEYIDWAWQVLFNYAKLNAVGQVLLNSGRERNTLTNQNAYVVCPTLGVEERIYFDLGLIKKIRLSNGLDFEVGAGVNANNTKVESSEIQIAGVKYSILDIWNGQSPSSYVGSYEYINQGGLGLGGYASLSLGITLPVGTALSLGYVFNYNKTNLQGYEKYAPHHSFRLTVALNNFSFFDK